MTEKQKKVIIKKVLQRDGVPWGKPFSKVGVPRNWNSKRKYHGINLMLFSALDYPSPFFITPYKAFENGITLNRGKSVFAVANIPKFRRSQEESQEEFQERKELGKPDYFQPYFHNLWNVSETSLWETLKNEKIEKKVIKRPEKIIEEVKFPVSFKEAGSAKCSFDKNNHPTIGMPLKEKFNNLTEYYSTYYHELIHSTKYILERKRKNVSEEAEYASEELVAEIGAWLLRQESGLDSPDLGDNSASYIAGWKKRIEKDPDILFWAMSKAEQAVQFILGKR